MPLRELKNVNTQVRRLGYFPALLKLLQGQHLSKEMLSTKFAAWGKSNQTRLEDYGKIAGSIVSSQKPKASRTLLKARFPQYQFPNSVSVYIDFTNSIGWVAQVGRVYSLTRIGRVLNALDKMLPPQQTDNPFILTLPQRLFFIYEIWRQDADVLFTIIQQLTKEPVPLNKLQSEFSISYQAHLTRRLRNAPSEKESTELLSRLHDIHKWQNPVRYAEQFVPPRLNWLLDLGLAATDTADGRDWFLTAAGHTLKENFANLESFTDGWIDANFFRFATEFFSNGQQCSPSPYTPAKDSDTLLASLKESLQLFRNGPVPKFSVTQVTLFLCIMLIAKERLVIDKKGILDALAQPISYDANNVIETRLSARENEAYIILNPI